MAEIEVVLLEDFKDKRFGASRSSLLAESRFYAT